jgi:hypothetical protein
MKKVSLHYYSLLGADTYEKARPLRERPGFNNVAGWLFAGNQVPQGYLKGRLAGILQVAVEVSAVVALDKVAEGAGVAQVQAHAVFSLIADAGHVAQFVTVEAAEVFGGVGSSRARAARNARRPGHGGFVFYAEQVGVLGAGFKDQAAGIDFQQNRYVEVVIVYLAFPLLGAAKNVFVFGRLVFKAFLGKQDFGLHRQEAVATQVSVEHYAAQKAQLVVVGALVLDVASQVRIIGTGTQPEADALGARSANRRDR